MSRRLGYGSLLAAVVLGLAASALQRSTVDWGSVQGVPLSAVVVAGLSAVAVAAGMYGLYRITLRLVVDRAPTKRRKHDVRNVVRLAFTAAATVAVLAVLTRQWLGLLVSFGVVGIALSFALQQPLSSLVG